MQKIHFQHLASCLLCLIGSGEFIFHHLIILSSLLDRKQKIHLSLSYYLVFFVSALHHRYCFVSALHHGYCSVSALHHGYCSYFSFLQIFHCKYGKAIWMSSGIIVTHLACKAYRLGGAIFFCVFPLFLHHGLCWKHHVDTLLFPFLPSLSSSPCFLSSPFY